MKGADLLAHMLVAYGVKYIFGVPGDTNVALYPALEKCGSALRHVMARDERSAGCMADAYARVTNRPGVMEVPSGAGPLYAIAAVAEAHVSSAPVIIITNDNPLPVEGRGFIAELDCVPIYQPVTKASFQVKIASKIPEAIRRAFRVATTGRPGAVHIAIPENLYREEVDVSTLSLHAEPGCMKFPAYPAFASQTDLQALHALIAHARRPLVVAGGGVNRGDAQAELQAFAERYRLPVVTTMTGQQSIPDGHELSIGIIGDNGFHPHANRAMEESDLLIYLGCKIGSVMSMGWTFPAPQPDRQIVQIDIDPEIVGNNTENTLTIVADAKGLLTALSLLDPNSKQDPAWLVTLNSWREQFWAAAARELKQARKLSGSPLNPRLIVDALSRRMRGPQLLLSDPGTPTPYLCRYLRLADDDSRIIMQRSFGGLGYALPAVVGAWFARPDIRPIGLFGDGSLGMSLGELETVTRLKIPAILMNFNNSAFGWIKALQKSHGNAGMSVDFSSVDYAKVAAAFGFHALRVETPDQLEAAMDSAFAHAGPVFLDFVVESVADKTPPVYRWLQTNGEDPLAIEGHPLLLNTAEESGP